MNGILVVDKPRDWTSHDVVAKLRGVFHEKRIGHSGTLDPMATGVLVVFLGRATRAVEFAQGHEKQYQARLRLGVETDTQDSTGTVLRTSPLRPDRAALEAVLPQFRGKIQQLPPMYSAVKVGGQKLYEIARRGGEVERAPRTVEISELVCTGEEAGEFVLDVTCSKGTYIRTLCHDIGQALGCGGVMSALRRTRAGQFRIEDAHSLEEVLSAADAGCAEALLLPVDAVFSEYPALTVHATGAHRLRNGGSCTHTAPDGQYRLYAPDGEFLALGTVSRNVCTAVKRFFEVDAT